MHVFYYDISFSSQEKAEYRILPNGIAKFIHEDFILFVRPANKVLVGEGQRLWLWASKNAVPELFFSEVYYPEGSSLMSKPDYFYVEILLYSKKEGYILNPKKLKVVNSRGEQIPTAKYVVAEERLEAPCNYGNGNLLKFIPLDGTWFSVDQERDENTFIKLPVGKRIGFAVRFNIPPPAPGDSFTISIRGIEYMNNPIEIPTINYDMKKTFSFAVQ